MESQVAEPLLSTHQVTSPGVKKMKRKRNKTESSSESRSKKAKTCRQAPDFTTCIDNEVSSFHIQTSSLYLPLSPVSQNFPIEGMCAEHLSPLILTYFPPFNGLVLSYSDPYLSETPFKNEGDTILLKNTAEYAVSWGWLTAEFLVLKPQKGTWLEGAITLQNDGFLGLVCWNLINASIERSRLPPDWEWKETLYTSESENQGQNDIHIKENTGYYVDGKGQNIDSVVKFRVADIEISQDGERGFLTIIGTMLSERDELEIVSNERAD